MSADQSVLIFTFSPVQAFISEARRAEDLYKGSAILANLAKAVVLQLGPDNVIYPIVDQNSAQARRPDATNVIVAMLPTAEVENYATRAEVALLNSWKAIAEKAKIKATNAGLETDAVWDNIWQRQTNKYWQHYWASAPIVNGDYPAAYTAARNLLTATKFSRVFAAAEEPGAKDSLSGSRSALHTKKTQNALQYWQAMTAKPKLFSSKVRPNGKERLDSLGVIKRFAEIEHERFLSTSSVAAHDFLQALRTHPEGRSALAAYAQALEALLGTALFVVSKDDPDWPYDGLFFYPEILSPSQLEREIGLRDVNTKLLSTAQAALSKLHTLVKDRPSPYYALMFLDGDSMGIKIDDLLKQNQGTAALDAHKQFSGQISAFSQTVRPMLDAYDPRLSIFIGGDDVNAFLPLQDHLQLGWQAADLFRNTVAGSTASAGIALYHHMLPLADAIETMRQAEQKAKKTIAGKDGVCVGLIKRSGVPLYARSKWAALQAAWPLLLQGFQNDELAQSLPYALLADAATMQGQSIDLRRLLLKQALARHTSSSADKSAYLETMLTWMTALDSDLIDRDSKETERNGFQALANWLVIARFVAQGGHDE